MRKFLMVLVLVLAIALMLVTVSSAQVSSYNTGFQVQNLSSSNDATITIVFYNQDGTSAGNVSDTVTKGESNTYFPLPVTAGFNGSVVISSDQPLAAVTNVIGDGKQGSSYTGFGQGSSTASLPIINKANFGINTWFNVQNAGSADTNVTVTYSGQPSCNENATIKPGASKTFDQATNTCLPAGYVGAATATASSGGSIVASGIQNAPSGLFAYGGFTGGSTNPVMPLVANNVFGIHTAIQIQNVGASSTNVTVSYSPADAQSSACTETKTIGPSGAEIFALYAFSLSGTTSSTCTFGAWFNGSAQVTTNSASQDLVAVINQTNLQNKGSSYNSFDPSAATSTVVMPIIMDAYSIYTGYNVVNVGGAATTVTCTYAGLASSYDDVVTLQPGEAMSRVQLNSGFPANTGGGYSGSATCTASGGGSILGVVNQANSNPATANDDTTLTYEAFNN
jgi:hypothetical protein